MSGSSLKNCHYERPGFGREESAVRGKGKKQVPRYARDDKRYKCHYIVRASIGRAIGRRTRRWRRPRVVARPRAVREKWGAPILPSTLAPTPEDRPLYIPGKQSMAASAAGRDSRFPFRCLAGSRNFAAHLGEKRAPRTGGRCDRPRASSPAARWAPAR